jgi:hypothetical protein
MPNRLLARETPCLDRRQFLQSLGWGVFSGGLSLAGHQFYEPMPPALGMSPNSLKAKATALALAKIKTLNTEFPLIGIYHRPNDQDRRSAGSGMGLYPCHGQAICAEVDHRSERVYPPFVMATRRQTDGLVRQTYLLLPTEIRQTTAFVIVDRLLQFPEAYLPYLSQKSQVVLIGSFFGIGSVQNDRDYWQTDNGTGTRSFHRLQLRQLEYAIAFMQSLNKPIVDIVYGMGDSTTAYAVNVRQLLTEKCQAIVQRAGLAPQLFSLDWGADELVFKAFARRLPPLSVKVVMANANAKHYYDANRTTAEIVYRTLAAQKLSVVTGDRFDMQVFVFDRHPSARFDFNQYFSPDNVQQADFDRRFRQQILAMPAEQKAKTVIIDGRNPNGALNSASLPNSDQYLGFGSWGTFANTCGQTLAMAKLLVYAQNPAAQRQLLLEAIAHDGFCIGYAAAQDKNSPLRQRLRQRGLSYIHKDPPEYRLDEIVQVFSIINSYVNQEMQQLMAGTRGLEFAVIPQLWRTFESQVLLKQGTLSVAGVYRKDLPSQTFNPLTILANAKTLTLEDLS